jgi:hypothetical protein
LKALFEFLDEIFGPEEEDGDEQDASADANANFGNNGDGGGDGADGGWGPAFEEEEDVKPQIVVKTEPEEDVRPRNSTKRRSVSVISVSSGSTTDASPVEPPTRNSKKGSAQRGRSTGSSRDRPAKRWV